MKEVFYKQDLKGAIIRQSLMNSYSNSNKRHYLTMSNVLHYMSTQNKSRIPITILTKPRRVVIQMLWDLLYP